MFPPPPLAAVPAPRDSKLRALSRVLWRRRWKIAGVVLVYALGRSCPFWPEWAQPFCELLMRLARAFPV